jgi:hypothetical protein
MDALKAMLYLEAQKNTDTGTLHMYCPIFGEI